MHKFTMSMLSIKKKGAKGIWVTKSILREERHLELSFLGSNVQHEADESHLM